MKIEKIVLVIAVCLIVLLTVLNAGQFITNQILVGRSNQVQAQVQQNAQQVQAFLKQLQNCQNIGEVDVVLQGVGINRSASEGKKR